MKDYPSRPRDLKSEEDILNRILSIELSFKEIIYRVNDLYLKSRTTFYKREEEKNRFKLESIQAAYTELCVPLFDKLQIFLNSNKDQLFFLSNITTYMLNDSLKKLKELKKFGNNGIFKSHHITIKSSKLKIICLLYRLSELSKYAEQMDLIRTNRDRFAEYATLFNYYVNCLFKVKQRDFTGLRLNLISKKAFHLSRIGRESETRDTNGKIETS